MPQWVTHILLVPLLMMLGCGALTGRAIPKDEEFKEKESAKGISYYLPKPTFTILRKGLAGGKKAIPQYEIAIGSVADDTRRFEVGMSQGVFTSDTFDLKMGTGQTVVSLNSKRTDEFGNTLAGLVGVAASVLPLVAKGMFLAIPGQPDLIEQILGAEAERFKEDTKIIQNNLKTGDPIVQAIRERWNKNSSTVETALEEGDKTKNIIPLPVLIKAVINGYEGVQIQKASGQDSAAKLNQPSEQSEKEKAEAAARKKELDDVEKSILAYEPVLSTIQSIKEGLGQRPKDSSKNMQKVLARLQAAVNEELISLISKKPVPTSSSNLTDAVANLKTAISLIVDGRDPLDRKLLGRQKVLTQFLALPLPKDTDNDGAKAYQKFSDELTKVTAALSAIIESDAGATSEVIPLATEVTSRIEKRIFLMKPRKADMTDYEIEQSLVPIAIAIVKHSKFEAVIIIN